MDRIIKILEAYSLEEIIEYNDEEISDILYYLVKEGKLKLPEVEPV